MNKWHKILTNAIVTAAITLISVLYAIGFENITTAVISSAIMAGMLSFLKEIQQEMEDGKKPKKPSKNKINQIIASASLF